MTISEFFIGYSAVVATAALAWNVVKYIRDKPKLIMHCWEGHWVTTDKDPNGLILDSQDLKELSVRSDVHINISEERYFFKTSNATTRPSTIVNFGIGYKEGGFVYWAPPAESQPFPRKIEDGESWLVWASKSSLENQILSKGKSPSYFFVKTATGKIYKNKKIPARLRSLKSGSSK